MKKYILLLTYFIFLLPVFANAQTSDIYATNLQTDKSSYKTGEEINGLFTIKNLSGEDSSTIYYKIFLMKENDDLNLQDSSDVFGPIAIKANNETEKVYSFLISGQTVGNIRLGVILQDESGSPITWDTVPISVSNERIENQVQETPSQVTNLFTILSTIILSLIVLFLILLGVKKARNKDLIVVFLAVILGSLSFFSSPNTSEAMFQTRGFQIFIDGSEIYPGEIGLGKGLEGGGIQCFKINGINSPLPSEIKNYSPGENFNLQFSVHSPHCGDFLDFAILPPLGINEEVKYATDIDIIAPWESVSGSYSYAHWSTAIENYLKLFNEGIAKIVVRVSEMGDCTSNPQIGDKDCRDYKHLGSIKVESGKTVPIFSFNLIQSTYIPDDDGWSENGDTRSTDFVVTVGPYTVPSEPGFHQIPIYLMNNLDAEFNLFNGYYQTKLYAVQEICVTGAGICPNENPETKDMCPNLTGDQLSVPENHFIDNNGDCVESKLQCSVSPTDGEVGQDIEFTAGIRIPGGTPTAIFCWENGGCSDGGSILSNPDYIEGKKTTSFIAEGTYNNEVTAEIILPDSTTKYTASCEVNIKPKKEFELLKTSCSPNPSIVNLNEDVTYSAKSTGGTDPKTYTWKSVDGTGTVLKNDSDFYTTKYSSVGKKTVAIETTDSTPQSARSICSVNVVEPTPDPKTTPEDFTVSCKPSINKFVVTLEASALNQPDKNSVSYSWKDNGIDKALSGKTINLVYTSAGEHTYEITATSGGESVTGYCTAKVPGNIPPPTLDFRFESNIAKDGKCTIIMNGENLDKCDKLGNNDVTNYIDPLKGGLLEIKKYDNLQLIPGSYTAQCTGQNGDTIESGPRRCIGDFEVIEN